MEYPTLKKKERFKSSLELKPVSLLVLPQQMVMSILALSKVQFKNKAKIATAFSQRDTELLTDVKEPLGLHILPMHVLMGANIFK